MKKTFLKTFIITLAALFALTAIVYVVLNLLGYMENDVATPTTPLVAALPDPSSPVAGDGQNTATTPVPEATPEPTPTPEPPAPWETFRAAYMAGSDPTAVNFTYDIQVDGTIAPEYLSPEPIAFKFPEYYADVPGVTTFRGNNFRDQPAWGHADIREEKLSEAYRISTGSIEKWTGVGWSGQPAIVQWDYEVQLMMNLLPEKREKMGLIEVIQGTMDGHVYFFDLEDGTPTRERLYFGEPIKGGISIDPRGYPLLCVGQGDNIHSWQGFYVYSLIDFSTLMTISGREGFAHRGWYAFDSNPLFDTDNDRMYIWGENGVLHNIKLNTHFDRANGKISIDPEIIRYRYRASSAPKLGTEGSPSAFGQYMFVSDNSGTLQCIDLMTMSPVWVFDGKDDTDSTEVLEWNEADERLYLYTGCQVKRPDENAYLRKLDAATGELLWEHSYPCFTDLEVTGGSIATAVSGKAEINDLVIFWVAKLRGMGAGGALVAIDKQSGEIVWENLMPTYGWSSPVAVYTEAGKAYLIVSDSDGYMYLMRATTGETLDRINLGGNIEASAAVWGNMIVVGTRGQRIFGIRIT